MTRPRIPQACREWAIEVNSDRDTCNHAAQEQFIVEFIAPTYEELAGENSALSGIQSLHFTRIYYPQRDNMGAYIRLRVFCAPGDLSRIGKTLDARLKKHFGEGSNLKIDPSDLDWGSTSESYGGREVADLFRDFLHNTSKTICELLTMKRGNGYDVERVLWPWTHFWFNNARGYSRDVIEVMRGVVTGFHQKI